MKRRTLNSLGIAVLALFAASNNYAQSGAPSNPTRSKQDQVMEELLREVHQLRMALEHISVNAYRGQVLVERLRLQQEQVSRLGRELGAIRNEIAETKAAQLNAKERLDDAEKQQDRGVIPEAELSQVRVGVLELKRREQTLSERETQLSVELDRERANLEDLNKRLDALEREMLLTGQSDESKQKAKR